MMVFLADTVEYGQDKIGRRNEAITTAINPVVNKMGGALSTGVISITLLASGIKTGAVAATSIDPTGQLIFKLIIIGGSLVCIIVSYLIFRKKYIIDSKKHDELLEHLHYK